MGFFTFLKHVRKRRAVPEHLLEKVEVVDMPGIRAFADKANHTVIQDLITSMGQESPEDFPKAKDGTKTYPMLTISGGSANGAYGAGLLKGWSEAGSRPKFKIVCGVSTGGLIAPLAFLGSDYDEELEALFTTMRTKDIAKKKFLGVILSDSFASNAPLARLIRKHSTALLLQAIAREHARGRRLYIGTTNLDAQRFVMWDMGAIATIGSEEAVNLFCDILLASAAIPAAFSPVRFHVTVEAEGQRFDEMHVDGGVMVQSFFLYGVAKGFRDKAREAGIHADGVKVKLYIIRNGFINPIWQAVPGTLAAITQRSFNTAINVQGLSDLYRMYFFTERSGGDFNLAYIPATFKQHAKEMFDQGEMKALFDTGYSEAVNGYPWRKKPPGVDASYVDEK